MISAFRARLAARVVAAGGVIAYPTEGVWGLGCDPWNEAAVNRLLALKDRDPAKGLILVAAEAMQFEPWLAPLSADQRQRLEATWPGPVTWLIPDPGVAPVWIRGRHTSVALRVSAHPVVAALCRALGGPLVSTSANPSGREAARTQLAVHRYFGAAVDHYTPGLIGGATGPSTIRDLISDKVLRGAGG